MRVLTLLAIGCVLVLGGWPQSALGDPFKLNSGKVVEIVSVKVTKTGKNPTLKLEFRSKTPLTDAVTLRKEADGLWEHFFVNAERGGHKRAVISALGPGKSGTRKPVNFTFVKRNGDWRTLENGLRLNGKLTTGIMRRFVDRMRSVFIDQNWNAARLYMAKEFTGTMSDPKFGAYAPKSLGREAYIANMRNAFEQISSWEHEDKILSIRLSPQGTSAEVDVRQKGRTRVRNLLVSNVVRSTSNFEVRNGTILWTRSRATVEDRVVTRAN